MNTTVRAQPLQPPRFDLHRSGPGQPSGPSPNPSQPTDDDIKQRASEIVNTGRGGFLGFGADPDARMQALAQRSQGLSAESRQRLVSEVIAQEPGSANNWLTADRLNRLTDSSRMSDADRQAVKEGVAGAYVAGDISYAQMQALMGVTMQFAPAVHVQQFQAARGFLSGDSPALSAARLQYTAHSFNRTGERASLGLGFGIDLDNALALT
ncbi:MAG: hypothetical protein Q4G71_10250, partial [Pseudomonadota bacterium]|nr:hypothetical protein [Pseudomonadota bacterium]